MYPKKPLESAVNFKLHKAAPEANTELDIFYGPLWQVQHSRNGTEGL